MHGVVLCCDNQYNNKCKHNNKRKLNGTFQKSRTTRFYLIIFVLNCIDRGVSSVAITGVSCTLISLDNRQTLLKSEQL